MELTGFGRETNLRARRATHRKGSAEAATIELVVRKSNGLAAFPG